MNDLQKGELSMLLIAFGVLHFDCGFAAAEGDMKAYEGNFEESVKIADEIRKLFEEAESGFAVSQSLN